MSETSQEQPVGNPIHSPDSSAKRLFKWGVGLTLAYALLAGLYIWRQWAQMLSMKPDQVATFVSGVVAPLGFLWLVLGFRQQGDELQNSARALWLQGEELRNSVEQQRQLVQVQREQLESEREQRAKDIIAAEHEAQPNLFLLARGSSYNGNGQNSYRFSLNSAGPTCSNVTVFRDNENWGLAHVVQANTEIPLHLSVNANERLTPIEVAVSYTDRLGEAREIVFLVPVIEQEGANQGTAFGEIKLIKGPLIVG